jgi:hypothetical protein
MIKTTSKFIFFEILGDILRFPVWWFTKGIKKFFLNFVKDLNNTKESLGIGIWVKNLFKPMFGVSDWQGKIISFLVRIVQIVARSIYFVFYTIFRFLIFVIWVCLPILIILQIINIFLIHGKY